MIRIERPEGPAALAEADGKGRAERQAAIDALAAHLNAGGSREEWKFSFRAYKLKDVNAAINSLFHGKCAYCESSYRGTQPVDVEHWRPKGRAVVEEGGEPMKPAYYWLAADWDNLLPSCIDCNRKRHQFDVIEEVTVSVGKQDEFPLADPRTRAEGPGEETREQPLLLHPCDDDPDAFLAFDEANQGVMHPREPEGLAHDRAKASIRVYGLNRVGLVLNRQMLAKQVALRIATIKGLARLQEQADEDSDVRLLIDELMMAEMRELARARSPERPYSLLARQLIDRQMEEFAELAGLTDEDEP